MPHLSENHYGKSRVRLVKVTRHADHNDLHEWNIGVYLTGDFTACFVSGDNSDIVATDTMKNTVYAVARTSTAANLELFGFELANFLSGRNPQATGIRITIEEKVWIRIKAATPPGVVPASIEKHPSAFLQRGPEVHTTEINLAPNSPPKIVSGVSGLVILKTADSAFAGFQRDELTTLPETHDRLLGTEATITWTYSLFPADFTITRTRILETLLTTFANHTSLSVQQTLYAMAEAALAAEPSLSDITLTMPNRHNIPVDLARLNLDNPNILFIPTDEPAGHIHARVVR